MKHTLILTLALAGCHDFEGELGALGFVSNLITRPGQPWTPQAAIAAGTPLEVAASALLTHDSDEAPRVEAAISGDLIALDPTDGDLALTGEAGDHGRLLFWGDATDRFSVRFAEPAAAVLYASDESAQTDIRILSDAVVTLSPEIQDAWGRPLGFSPAQLEVSGCPAEVGEGGGIRLHAADCLLDIALDGIPLARLPITAVPPADIDTLTLSTERLEQDPEPLIRVQAWTVDGEEILGIVPEWRAEAEAVPAGDALLLPVTATGSVSAELDGRRWRTVLAD